MRIRQEQMDALEIVALRNFEKSVAEEMSRRFPKHAALLGEDGLREKVHQSIGSARGHGFTSSAGLRLFVRVSFVFGIAFNSDPQYPWAAEVLNAKESPEPKRCERLAAQARKCAAAIAGPGGRYLSAAFDRFGQPPDQAPLAVLQYLAFLYPEKCQYAGERAMRGLLEISAGRARTCGLTTDRGVSHFVAMALLFGCGFDRDPLFAFAPELLTSAVLADPDEKADLLRAGALRWLDRWRGNPAPAARPLERAASAR